MQKAEIAKKAETRLKGPRRTHAERSTETRQKLCEAALQLLSELGYERVTTALIAQRAAVSKGAQTHHFPAKADVLAGAFEHLLTGWKERRAHFWQEQGGTSTLDTALRYLWHEVFSRPDYIAAVELMLAARHDSQLRDKLQAQLATWTVARDDMFRRATGLDGDLEKTSTFLSLNYCVLRGMAIYDGINERSDNGPVLELWISMAKNHIQSEARL
ncbi:TetR/AcrR family transcriptional regulator [Variovorax paradoxus]|uniref:TetR/AcrR family transcriptional regulator n=1 Tax=Variovorax paradoxus TaxID=34073 RepID=UPI0021AC1E47|nr:TetR/AcrR family transcriptional regulator [Variovorax paradoxus]UVH60654.1 TetR/AcrR family transcriptional regulator [Variovorax paradoxus]